MEALKADKARDVREFVASIHLAELVAVLQEKPQEEVKELHQQAEEEKHEDGIEEEAKHEDPENEETTV